MSGWTAHERSAERESLIADLEEGGYLNDPRLEEAMLRVPRHMFLPDDLREAAYQDRPLPVGHGQTISAPHMVAMMTTALQLVPGQRVLEVGAGMGYHAAVVKAMVGAGGHVTSIEYVEALADEARRNLAAAGFDVEVIHGDGFEGHAAGAPYDAILVTCAVPRIPDALVEQLKEGGHLVAPEGTTRCQLIAARKVDGALVRDDLGACLFVNAQGRLGAAEGDPEDFEPAP